MARAMRTRKQDVALIGITDAFLTLLILSVASFALTKASYASTDAAETATRTFFIEEVAALHAALERSTVRGAAFFAGTPAEAPRDGARVALLVGEIHYYLTEGRKAPAAVQGIADAILANGDGLANGRWSIAIQVTAPAAATAPASSVCVAKPVRLGACADLPEMGPSRYTSDIRIPRPNTLGESLVATMYAFRPVGA